MLDLKAEEFEVFEDGVEQKVEQIRARGCAPGRTSERSCRGQLPARVAAGRRQSQESRES